MRYSFHLAIFLLVPMPHIMSEPQNWDASCYEGFWKTVIAEGQKQLLKRQEIADQTLSVIIPCYYKHAIQLASLLHSYETQTRLPDEVVISLSEADRVEESVLKQLRDELWAFPVRLITSKSKQLAGQNRNIACSNASGDIFMCQDADDIPHPQRVEIIHFLFATYAIDHLMHGYKRIKSEDFQIPFVAVADVSRVQFAQIRNFEVVFGACLFSNGNPAIARHVFEAVKWTGLARGEDTEFNRKVYNQFSNCIVVRAILHCYREFLSSSIRCELTEDHSHSLPVGECIQKRYALTVIEYDLVPNSILGK